MRNPMLNYTLPLLVVFGLDNTLWPFSIGYKSDVYPPFQRQSFGVTDKNNRTVHLYEDVLPIFKELDQEEVMIGVTSTNAEVEGTRELLTLFRLEKYILFREAYKDSKLNQFIRYGMTDCHNKSVRISPDIKRIFQELEEEKVWIGVTSNNSYSEANQDLLYMWTLDEHITFKEIEPDTMINKFTRIREDSGLDYSKMLFFDDDSNNIRDVSKLGVLGITVKNGMTMKLLRDGITEYRVQRKIDSQPKTAQG